MRYTGYVVKYVSKFSSYPLSFYYNLTTDLATLHMVVMLESGCCFFYCGGGGSSPFLLVTHRKSMVFVQTFWGYIFYVILVVLKFFSCEVRDIKVFIVSYCS